MVLARKLDTLKFIMKRGLIWRYELEEEFGYSHWSITKTLTRLKRQGLIINMTRGCWELTEKGYDKLEYYGRR